jgi:hypothetical protein
MRPKLIGEQLRLGLRLTNFFEQQAAWAIVTLLRAPYVCFSAASRSCGCACANVRGGDVASRDMSGLLNDARYWRDRAEEARAIAAVMYFDSTRQQMLEIAEGYERLAEQAEERTKSNWPKDT